MVKKGKPLRPRRFRGQVGMLWAAVALLAAFCGFLAVCRHVTTTEYRAERISADYRGEPPGALEGLAAALALRPAPAIRGRPALERHVLSLGEQAAPALRLLARDQTPAVRAWAVEMLARLPESKLLAPAQCAQDLIACLADEDKEVQLRALCCLGAMDAPPRDAILAIAEQLRGRHEAVRQEAHVALLRLGPAAEPALPLIVRAATFSDNYNPRGLYLKIGPAAVPHLRSGLKDANWRVRGHCCRGLAELGPAAKAAAADLRPLLSDPVTDVAENAQRALVLVAGETGVAAAADGPTPEAPAAPGGLAGRTVEEKIRTIEQFVRIDPPTAAAADEVARGLDEKDLPVRLRAVEALGDMGRRGLNTTPALAKALRDADGRARIAAAMELERMGPRASVAMVWLLAAADDSDAGVRSAVCQALRTIAQDSADHAPLLAKALSSPHADVRAFAASQLRQIGPAAAVAAEPLVAVLARDAGQTAGEEALAALIMIGRGAVPALAQALGQESDQVRLLSLGALGRIGWDARAAAPAVVQVLQGKDARLRRQAMDTLARMGPGAAEAVRPLLKALGECDVAARQEIAEALRLIAPHAAGELDTLLAAFKDREPCVRQAAAEAVGQMGVAAERALPALRAVYEDQQERTEIRQAAGEAAKRILAAVEAAKDQHKGLGDALKGAPPPAAPGRNPP